MRWGSITAILLGSCLTTLSADNLVSGVSPTSPYKIVSNSESPQTFFDYAEAYNVALKLQKKMLVVIGVPTAPVDYKQCLDEKRILVIVPTCVQFPTPGRRYLNPPLQTVVSSNGSCWYCNGLKTWTATCPQCNSQTINPQTINAQVTSSPMLDCSSGTCKVIGWNR